MRILTITAGSSMAAMILVAEQVLAHDVKDEPQLEQGLADGHRLATGKALRRVPQLPAAVSHLEQLRQLLGQRLGAPG